MFRIAPLTSLAERLNRHFVVFRVLKALSIIGFTLSRASKDDFDRLRKRIELLRRDAEERPHLADTLLRLAEELEKELKRLREQNGETGNS